jgi:hypothetical protein
MSLINPYAGGIVPHFKSKGNHLIPRYFGSISPPSCFAANVHDSRVERNKYQAKASTFSRTVRFFDDQGIVSLARLLQRNQLLSLYICESDWTCSVWIYRQVEALVHNALSTMLPSTSLPRQKGNSRADTCLHYIVAIMIMTLKIQQGEKVANRQIESEPEPDRLTLGIKQVTA